MKTEISSELRDTPLGREADAILRSCVHCGFCTATCPTYQLLGDELDGPRGRIYLIKQVLEGQAVSSATQAHLDRCLTCRACETTCPSGVRYGRLAEIGRELVDAKVGRPWVQRLARAGLRQVIPYPQRFGALLAAGRTLRPLLPRGLRSKVPGIEGARSRPAPRHERRVVLFEGCVQPLTAPNTNAAAARVLDRLGISVQSAPQAGCCGALSLHLNARPEALEQMRRNIDAWWPAIEDGAEGIVFTASACGAMAKDYAEHLRHDPDYAAKAARVSTLARDIAEVLEKADVEALPAASTRRVAFHCPCTLQHGQGLAGRVESILRRGGFPLSPVQDPHLCCGSAGTYSILQPVLSGQLLDNKLTALQAGDPELIATANIGCQLHLASAAAVPVLHWIELFDPS